MINLKLSNNLSITTRCLIITINTLKKQTKIKKTSAIYICPFLLTRFNMKILKEVK